MIKTYQNHIYSTSIHIWGMSIHKSSMNPNSLGVKAGNSPAETWTPRTAQASHSRTSPSPMTCGCCTFGRPGNGQSLRPCHAMLHCTPSGKPMAADPQTLVDHSHLTRLFSCRSAHSAAVNGARLNGKVSRNRMMNQSSIE